MPSRRKMKNDMSTLGARLCGLREGFGLSQSQVADYLDMNQSLLSRIEKGERAISINALEKLADLYCVPAYELAYGEDCNANYELAFRAKPLTSDDMILLSKINRIILNQRYMDSLSKGK